MEPTDYAALKRKYAATEEPAKKAELKQQLQMLNLDPDEVTAKPGEGRTANPKVTAEQTRPQAEVAEKQKDEEVPAPAGRARNGRIGKSVKGA